MNEFPSLSTNVGRHFPCCYRAVAKPSSTFVFELDEPFLDTRILGLMFLRLISTAYIHVHGALYLQPC